MLAHVTLCFNLINNCLFNDVMFNNGKLIYDAVLMFLFYIFHVIKLAFNQC